MPTAQKEITTSIQKSVACGIYSLTRKAIWLGDYGRCQLNGPQVEKGMVVQLKS
jgi:hypothetical protein